MIELNSGILIATMDGALKAIEVINEFPDCTPVYSLGEVLSVARQTQY